MSLPATQVQTGATPLPRFVARASGEAALTLLHDTTTQDLAGLVPGRSTLTCYLDEKGRLLAEVRVSMTPDGAIVLDGEEAGRAAIVERLARIAPLSGVTIEPTEDAVTAARVTDGWVEPGACVERDGAVLVGTEDGYDIIGAAPADLPAVPFERYEAARIAAGRARFGVDIAPGTLVNETPLMRSAVAAAKGCYPGQESVAKVHNLGSIRRHLVLLHADAALPDAPAVVTADGDEVGSMTSAAGSSGIATVRATHDAGATLEVGGVRAVVERVL